jgi:hypothetical protein
VTAPRGVEQPLEDRELAVPAEQPLRVYDNHHRGSMPFG